MFTSPTQALVVLIAIALASGCVAALLGKGKGVSRTWGLALLFVAGAAAGATAAYAAFLVLAFLTGD